MVGDGRASMPSASGTPPIADPGWGADRRRSCRVASCSANDKRLAGVLVSGLNETIAVRERAMRTHSPILCIGVAASVALFAAANVAHAQDKAIRIGGLFAMSGPGSYFGVQDKQGIELAIEQINKAGVNGHRFEVQYEDSACSPLPATQAAKRLLDQDHRSRQPMDVSYYAQRGDAGRRHRHQCP